MCCLKYSKHENELISTHGFSNNEINIWNKQMKRTHVLKGHTQRVLYLSMDPSGNQIVTGAADETLRFWDLGYLNLPNKKPFQEIDFINSMMIR